MSRPIHEVKPLQARLVRSWETRLEVRVLSVHALVRLYSSVGRACASYIEYEFPGHSLAPVSHKRKVRGSIPRGGYPKVQKPN